jgi:hypothetical protein
MALTFVSQYFHYSGAEITVKAYNVHGKAPTIVLTFLRPIFDANENLIEVKTESVILPEGFDSRTLAGSHLVHDSDK